MGDGTEPVPADYCEQAWVREYQEIEMWRMAEEEHILEGVRLEDEVMRLTQELEAAKRSLDLYRQAEYYKDEIAADYRKVRPRWEMIQ